MSESQNKMLSRVPSAPTPPFEGQRERECGMVNALHISNRKSVNPVRSGTRVVRRARAQPRAHRTGQLSTRARTDEVNHFTFQNWEVFDVSSTGLLGLSRWLRPSRLTLSSRLCRFSSARLARFSSRVSSLSEESLWLARKESNTTVGTPGERLLTRGPQCRLTPLPNLLHPPSLLALVA